MARKIMKLVDSTTGLMVCKVCGAKHYAQIQSGADRANGITSYFRGSWQCQNGCNIDKYKQIKTICKINTAFVVFLILMSILKTNIM